MKQDLFIIKREKIDKKNYSVQFSNERTEVFTENEVMEHYLYEDSVPLNISYEDLMRKVNKKRAVSATMSYVALTLRTEKQVEDKLLKKGYDANIICDVLQHIRELGFLNDKEYARKYVNTCLKTKVISQKMCEYELIKKGIEEEIASNAVLAIDDEEQAAILLKKKMKTEKDELKLKKFLYSKGFTMTTINRLIRDNEEW